MKRPCARNTIYGHWTKKGVFQHISGSIYRKVFNKGSLEAKFDPLTNDAGDVIVTLQWRDLGPIYLILGWGEFPFF